MADGSFSWTWCDSHLMSLFFGELPSPANDADGFRMAPARMIDARTREEFTPEKFRAWLEAPMPDSVAPIKTTREHDKPPE